MFNDHNIHISNSPKGKIQLDTKITKLEVPPKKTPTKDEGNLAVLTKSTSLKMSGRQEYSNTFNSTKALYILGCVTNTCLNLPNLPKLPKQYYNR